MKISKLNRENRNLKYGVKWEENGNPRHKFFKTKSARDGFHQSLKEKAKQEGPAIFEISSEQARILQLCIHKLGNIETVLQAVLEYEKRNCPHPITLKDAIQEHLNEGYNLGRDTNWMRAGRVILERFELTHSGNVNSISQEEATRWVHSLKFAPSTIENHADKMKAFYNWCIDRGYAAENPFLKVPPPDVIPHEPEFLKVAQMEKLMETAKKYYPDAVAYFALNGFAGLRSSACARIGLEDIDFKQRGILIRAVNAKNKRRIYIDGHPDNLWEWLNWAKKNAPEGFALSKRLWDRRRGQIQQKANITMPHNALRHSFCTYHVALHGDAGKTATLLTHRGNVSILYEHYKGNTSKAQAEKFFNISPASTS
jgi:site-specific recombinase XerD